MKLRKLPVARLQYRLYFILGLLRDRYDAIEVLVDEHGRVTDTRLVRGIPASDLNDVAIEAVKRWTYRPAIKDGVAVKVWRPEQIRFKL